LIRIATLDRVRQRLSIAGGPSFPSHVAGFYHPDDQEALRELQRRGEVYLEPGEGRDRGLLLARKLRDPVSSAAPPPSGDAA
jgi:hypothetical protein